MPDSACTAESSDQQESADGGYFAALAPARYMRITTFNRHGLPVSASVPGVVDGDRAYFRARNRSGMVKRLRQADVVQATPSGVLGFCIYGPPLDAIARRLSGDAAGLAAAKLDGRSPLRRRSPIRLRRRQAVYYELVAAEAPGDQDRPADSSASLIIRVHTRQQTSCADATTPTSLATVCAPLDHMRTIRVSMALPGLWQAPAAEKPNCPADSSATAPAHLHTPAMPKPPPLHHGRVA